MKYLLEYLDENGATMTVRQAAKFLNVPASTLYDLVQRREIEHIRYGRRIRFTKEHLARWIERNTVAACGKGLSADRRSLKLGSRAPAHGKGD